MKHCYFIVDDVITESGREGFEVLHGDPQTAIGFTMFKAFTLRECVSYIERKTVDAESYARVKLARRHGEHAVIWHRSQKVVFRKFSTGEVIAFLCNSAADCNAGNVMTYMHVGQHGEAARGLGRNLELATPDEYAPLLAELSAIYAPAVIEPVTRLTA